MSTPNRSNGSSPKIFRANAISNYIKGREESVLPRFVSPRVFIYLWLLMVLLLMAVGAAWYIEYPVYQPTLAIVMDVDPPSQDGSMQLLVLLPTDTAMNAGDPIVLSTGQGSIKTFALDVLQEPLSPSDFRERFDLDPTVELMITQPVKVALIETNSASLPNQLYGGSFFQANIEVRRQRVLSLLPLIGKYF